MEKIDSKNNDKTLELLKKGDKIDKVKISLRTKGQLLGEYDVLSERRSTSALCISEIVNVFFISKDVSSVINSDPQENL